MNISGALYMNPLRVIRGATALPNISIRVSLGIPSCFSFPFSYYISFFSSYFIRPNFMIGLGIANLFDVPH